MFADIILETELYGTPAGAILNNVITTNGNLIETIILTEANNTSFISRLIETFKRFIQKIKDIFNKIFKSNAAYIERTVQALKNTDYRNVTIKVRKNINNFGNILNIVEKGYNELLSIDVTKVVKTIKDFEKSGESHIDEDTWDKMIYGGYVDAVSEYVTMDVEGGHTRLYMEMCGPIVEQHDVHIDIFPECIQKCSKLIRDLDKFTYKYSIILKDIDSQVTRENETNQYQNVGFRAAVSRITRFYNNNIYNLSEVVRTVEAEIMIATHKLAAAVNLEKPSSHIS